MVRSLAAGVQGLVTTAGTQKKRAQQAHSDNREGEDGSARGVHNPTLNEE